uniref:Uncharacterized protein n=1 Tax=Oryza sativa subsp. japonica TaxID=39947 RepID=Q33BC1_ORYSJ|nr:hypothetical protein LOC_Os10g03270 [Oryza sativa Japonica Group]
MRRHRRPAVAEPSRLGPAALAAHVTPLLGSVARARKKNGKRKEETAGVIFMPRESVAGDELGVILGKDDVRMIRISCGMLRLKIDARSW